MDEAASDTASGMRAEETARWLGVLAARWADAYMTGCDGKGWWAARRGVIGEFFRAGSPEELGRMIQAHSEAWPS